MAEKLCKKCGIIKNVCDFHKDSGAKDGLQYYCKVCNIAKNIQVYYNDKKYVQDRVIHTRKLQKEIINKIKSDNGCLVCKESCYACLEFHHLDPNTKEDDIGRLVNVNSKQKLIDEVNKCIILCCNCHRKHHANMIQLPSNLVPIEISIDIFASIQRKITNNGIYRPNLARQKYAVPTQEELIELSKTLTAPQIALKYKCRINRIHQLAKSYGIRLIKSDRITINWPSIEEMAKLVWEKPRTHIAKEMGISDNAIKKFCKRNNIEYPPNGYWKR